VSARPRTAAGRLERLRRDHAAYRRISLARRSHARFRRDLAIAPHPFLLVGRMPMAPLALPLQAVQHALRGEAVWTLDTAARLLTGHGFLAARDLTGYLSPAAFARAAAAGLIGEPQAGGICVEPLYRRDTMLIAHLTNDPPAAELLPTGDCVVAWDFLLRDVLGTLGWRPDLLTRLEATRPPAPPLDSSRTAGS
jgi:hypothetical protein